MQQRQGRPAEPPVEPQVDPPATRTVDAPARPVTALEHVDNVLQLLVAARFTLDLGDEDRTRDAIDAAIATARRTLSELLTHTLPTQTATHAGALVRSGETPSSPAAAG